MDSSPQTNGFVERFNRTVLDEFFRQAFRTTLYESVEALQKDLDKWLKYYNFERTHQGYRNMGKRPFDTVDQFIKPVRKNSLTVQLTKEEPIYATKLNKELGPYFPRSKSHRDFYLHSCLC